MQQQLARLKGQIPPCLSPMAGDRPQSKAALLAVFGWTSSQYWGTDRFKRLFRLQHATKLLALLQSAFPGSVLPTPAWEDADEQARPQAAAAWLDALGQALTVAVDEQLNAAQPLPYPRWRTVPRAQAARIQAILERGHRAAIVGMSGSGKSVLARDFLDSYKDGPTLLLDAPKPDGGLLPEGNVLALGFELARFLIRHIDPRLQREHQGWRGLRQHAERLASGTLGAIGQDSLAQRKKNIADQLAQAMPRDLATVLLTLVLEMERVDAVALIVQHVAMMLPRATKPAAGRLLVVLDDVWLPAQLVPLLDALAPAKGVTQETWPVRLLLTSQDRQVLAAGRLDPAAAAATVEFDRDEADPPAFAWQVLAAWAAPGDEALTASKAAARIAAFRRDRIDASPQRAVMEQVLLNIGWHPLTTAAIGALWREMDHREVVWTDLHAALASAMPETLTLGLPEARRVDANEIGLNKRHTKILDTLLFVTQSSLSDVERARFRDLAIYRPGAGPLPVALFEYFWRRVPRDGRPFNVVSGRNPIEGRFADLMLVQQRSNGFFLHDMLRRAIEADLLRQRESLAQRHRDLLVAAGIASPEGRLLLDADRDFTLTDPIPGRPASERCRLSLRLLETDRQPPDPELRARLSRYFLDEMVHHVRGAAAEPGFDELEADLLTCLPFLQAQLDWEE